MKVVLAIVSAALIIGGIAFVINAATGHGDQSQQQCVSSLILVELSVIGLFLALKKPDSKA